MTDYEYALVLLRLAIAKLKPGSGFPPRITISGDEVVFKTSGGEEAGTVTTSTSEIAKILERAETTHAI